MHTNIQSHSSDLLKHKFSQTHQKSYAKMETKTPHSSNLDTTYKYVSVTSIIILSIFPPYSLIHISFLFFKICLVCLGTIYDLRLLRLEMCWVLETSILGTDLNNINSDCCLDLLSGYYLWSAFIAFGDVLGSGGFRSWYWFE